MLKILFILSVRSLRSHKITTCIVGSIIFFGTWLGVTGTALLDSLEHSLAKTLISSVAGHLQVYSSAARDDLALFGSGFSAVDDVAQMPNFNKVRGVLLKDDNVEAVVPMGIGIHALVQGNELDKMLGMLGRAARNGDAARLDVLSRQVRDIALEIQREVEERVVVAADSENLAARCAAVRRVQTPEFWQALRADPEPQLEFLDTHLAPLGGANQAIYLRNLGTDLQAFSHYFDRFQLVDGQMVPPTTRGILLAKNTYESQLKHPVARTLDGIRKGLELSGHTLASDPLLREDAERLPEQYQRITFQLAPEQARRLRTSLREFLHDTDNRDLQGLLRSFLTVDDANFAERYAYFYSTIAPNIRLYSVRIGDLMTLQSITHAGYTKSVKVRVWGTFQFAGLDKSAFAGTSNLMDLITFRELYGARDAAQQEELDALRHSVTVTDINREDAEAQMFGTPHVRARRTVQAEKTDFSARMFSEARRLRHGSQETFTQAELDDGLALNAAVLLKDPHRLAATEQHLERLVQQAGLPVQVVDWKVASGLVSKFIKVVHMFLYIATAVIFLVALVIMSNAMTMATAERTREIGTIRAMGGQRSFIMVMYIFETLTLGCITGMLGAAAGWTTISLVHHEGIAAASDVMVFLFSGPRLYPTIAVSNIIFGMVAVMLVSMISTIYPAHVATRIQPVVAMAPKE